MFELFVTLNKRATNFASSESDFTIVSYRLTSRDSGETYLSPS